MKPLLALLLTLATAGLAIPQSAFRNPQLSALPDPRLTPGNTLPVTTAEICRPGYTRLVRYVPANVRRGVLLAYGLRHAPHNYELDHLIPLCLGGSNNRRNLWPEPRGGEWGAEKKDSLELELHREVCSGRLPLAEAQHAIATNWITAYGRFVP